MSDLIYNQIAQNSINIVSDMPSVGIHVPDTNVGELISRKSAIEVASRECHEFRGIFADIEKGLNQLPSVQPRKGKWITDNPHSEIYRYACSECHAHHRARYDFCPSCGCCMEEGDAK